MQIKCSSWEIQVCLHFLFHTENNHLDGLQFKTIMTPPKKTQIDSHLSDDNLTINYLEGL